tara:strand:+ start:1331 stop:1519 length:189 start_codon:yes stop_codon:yes gene_type:complete
MKVADMIKHAPDAGLNTEKFIATFSVEDVINGWPVGWLGAWWLARKYGIPEDLDDYFEQEAS